MTDLHNTRWLGVAVIGCAMLMGCDPSGGSAVEAEPPGTTARSDRQEPSPDESGASGRVGAESLDYDEDVEDRTFCVGMDWRPRDRLPPTPDACDPHSDETHVAVYEGAAAMDAMRACSFEGATDRRPYTAIRIPRALLDGLDADAPRLMLDVTHPGIEVWRHQHLVDGVTPCDELPMGTIGFGEGLTREGESVKGLVYVSRDAGGRFVGSIDITFEMHLGAYGASAWSSSSEVYGVETLW